MYVFNFFTYFGDRYHGECYMKIKINFSLNHILY
jgi:hypothetical protein